MRHVELIADGVIAAVKAHVAGAVGAISKRMDAWEARLAAIPAGPKGDKGDAGESIRGEQGIPGERGESVKGEKGDPGERGPAGEVGPTGERGADGASGPQGAAGERGAAGAQGEVGPTGASVKGDPGETGKDGKDADPAAIESLIATGIQTALNLKVAPAINEGMRLAIAALPKPVDGIDGKDGASIHPDTVALMVREAVDKAVAAIPQALAADGRDGRDAAQIEPLPAIDEARSYPRGTWAKHAGGLWLARALTDGMTGWDCIVDGVASIGAVEAGDVRSFTLSLATSSGKTIALPFTVPAVLDRGVWREGEYVKGDHVSWDGSGWIAQKATTDKPGASDAWRLSTKRGRDGKDGKSFDAPPTSTPVVRTK
ncbi:MAG: hypothetical protein ACTS6J_01930 [Burkholderiales bacterium]